MKIRKDIFLEELERYGYHYEDNLVVPTYKKITMYGNKTIIIEVVIASRQIFINKSDYITNKNILFIHDLITDNLIER